MPGFIDSMNRSIDVVVPLALQAQKIRSAEAAESAKFAFEKKKWEDQLLQAKEKATTDHAVELVKMGVAPTADLITKLGGTPQYNNINIQGALGDSAEALRTQARPTIENLSITPTNITGRGFQSEDFEGATRFDVSGREFVSPVPLEIQKLKQTLEAKNAENTLTRQGLDERSAAANEARVNAARIMAGGQDARLDKTLEGQAQRTADTIAAGDRRTTAQIAAADRRAETTKAPKESDKRANVKMIADAETVILSNIGKKEAGPKVDVFNQFADKPYAYVWEKGTIYGGEWKQIKLPSINGKQVTAKDVYDTAAARAAQGITYDEVLKAIGAK